MKESPVFFSEVFLKTILNIERYGKKHLGAAKNFDYGFHGYGSSS